jgi:hypothetical protein
MKTVASTSTASNADQILRALARALHPYFAELGAESKDSGDVDLATVPPGKRKCYRACRLGEILGAYQRCRKWFAPKASYEAWLASITRRAPTQVMPSTTAPTDQSSEDRLAAKLGLRIVGGGR